MPCLAGCGTAVTASVTIRLSTGGKLLAFPGRMRLAERMRIERWDSGDTATAMARNAASNEHMIAVNEALGYEVVEPGYRHCELAVAGVR
jgi:hypothetical protein